jgi:signal transduction histidine kinase
MSQDWASAHPSFDAYLRRRNAQRVQFASWYFAAIMSLLIIIEQLVPVLRSPQLAAIQAASALYCCVVAWLCRDDRTGTWPPQALSLLFGAGMTVTALLYTLNLESRFGANPAYATLVFVACLIPLWTRRALLSLLVPVHSIYLWIIFSGDYGTTFRTVMTMGGTVALPLGVVTAVLAFRGERQAFEDMAAIRALLDERRDMVAMVAHDLQSPLAGIRALLRTMAGQSEADARKLAEIARTCGDMHGAVTRLVQAHQHDAAVQPVIATMPIDAVLQDARARALSVASEKSIAILIEAAGNQVSADASLLSAMLDNLLSNAIKFSPAGSVVRLGAEARGSEVRVSVIDNGPGIALEDSPLLFRKFSRLRTQPTGGEPTSGLGLYIVRALAESMGVRAGFVPNPGGGSVFYIDLPRADGEIAQRHGASTALSSMPYQT